MRHYTKMLALFQRRSHRFHALGRERIAKDEDDPDDTYPDIKMGEPHFVDFGRDLQYSPDGKAYLVAHGHADSSRNPQEFDPHWNWDDAVYLARVTPSVQNMNDASQYEFYAGLNAGNKPVWSKRFSDLKPVLNWNENMGQVNVTDRTHLIGPGSELVWK